MANNPELLKMPLARDGQKSTIPETTDASTGLFSQQYGWQSINSLPPQAGGKAVKREDFNGAFNLLGGIAFMAQKGFTFNFDATQDYYAGCVVIDTTDGQKYECIADVVAGGSAPSADSTHWQLAGNNSADIDVWFRQASTVYNNGAIALLLTLPTGWYLECTGTGGTTDAGDLVITSPAIGATVPDGTVTWTIREVASTADIPAPVDISGKANVDLDNLSAAGEAKLSNIPLNADFTIIYPNGGTETNPANINASTRYIESNPFPGYYVNCIVEILYNGDWSQTGWGNSAGVKAYPFNNDKIVIRGLNGEILTSDYADGNPFGVGGAGFTVHSLPCRVKVWKIGKIPTA
jgi:hypothetical protein